jgi:hypothetical protein
MPRSQDPEPASFCGQVIAGDDVIIASHGIPPVRLLLNTQVLLWWLLDEPR